MRKHEPALTPEQCTLRRNAVIGELNERCRGTDINYGEWSLFVAQARTWDGLSRQPGLQQFIGMARIQPYYGKQEPPAEKMVEPEQPAPVVESEEQEIQTEEKSQGSSPPTQPMTPKQPSDSEQITSPSLSQSVDDDSPPAQPVVEEQTQINPQTQDENSAQKSRHTQPSREIADNTQPQQQPQTPMQGTSRPEQAQQIQEEPPHPVENAIRAGSDINVQVSPMVKSAQLAKQVLSKTGSLNSRDAQAITGDDAEKEPLRAISSPNASESTRANIEANQDYIREAMETFRCHHEIDAIDAAGFLIQGLIKEGAITYLNGNSGCGKTFLLAGLLYCIATGQDFAGRKTEQRDCWCFEMEDADDLNFRVIALEKAFGKASDRLHLTDLQIKPSNNRDLALLQKILVDNCDAGKPPPVIAFDTLSFMIDGSENDSTDVMSFVESLLALHAEFGATFICISHNGKDESKGIAGSHKFFAHAKTVYQIKGDTYDGNWVLMVPDKVRFANKMTIKVPLCPYTLAATEKYPDGIETQYIDYTKSEDVPNYFDADVDESGNPCAVEVSQNECYVVYALGLLSLEGEKTVSEDSFRDKLNTLLGNMSDKKNQNKRLRIIKQLRQMAGKGMIRGEKLGDEKTLFSLPDSHPYTLKN